MNKQSEKSSASAPGRICLLGEHQDYLGLPVIPAAINLRITVTGVPRDDNLIRLDLPDVNDRDEFSLDGEVPYVRKRDYLRSVVNIVRRHGVEIPHGFDCVVKGDIPINSGTSSSSALCVAWAKFLIDASGAKEFDDPEKIARLAHESEVLEFDEPGGMMDHFATSLGDVNHVQFEPEFRITPLDAKFGSFVLGDSLQEKDTVKTLGRINRGVNSAVERIRGEIPDFNLLEPSLDDFSGILGNFPEDERNLLIGTLLTRDIVRDARARFVEGNMTDEILGEFLNRQQDVLREHLKVSTAKLDLMIQAAISAGALGGKVNGSGEGGCMFAYAPGNADAVRDAIDAVGGKAIIVDIGPGVSSI